MSSDELEIEILENGEIKFCRCNKEQNDQLIEILSQLISEGDEKAVKEFFEGSNSIESIIGENMCG